LRRCRYYLSRALNGNSEGYGIVIAGAIPRERCERRVCLSKAAESAVQLAFGSGLRSFRSAMVDASIRARHSLQHWDVSGSNAAGGRDSLSELLGSPKSLSGGMLQQKLACKAGPSVFMVAIMHEHLSQYEVARGTVLGHRQAANQRLGDVVFDAIVHPAEAQIHSPGVALLQKNTGGSECRLQVENGSVMRLKQA